MKKTYALLILSISLFCFSCKKFLETNPQTQISEDEFYKTPEQVNMGLYAIINDVQTFLLEPVFSNASLMSDEAETGGGIGEGVYKYKYDHFTFDPTNSPSWWYEWDYGVYNGVTSANLLISKLKSSGLPDGTTKPLDAEARFYRTLFYYYIFMGYEQAPLITEPLAINQIYTVKKGTREEIYNFMMSDLADDVIQNLPSKNSALPGRANKEAALILRTKIILFQRDEKSYPKALNDMKNIISSRQFSLVPDFASLWLKAGENSTENIWNLQFAGNNTGEGNPIALDLSGRSVNDPRSADQGGLESGYGQSTMPLSVYNWYQTGDTRREGTIIDYKKENDKVLALVASGALPAGSVFSISAQQENFVWLGHFKYHARKETSSQPNPLNNYAMPFRFFRYADVLLLGTELQIRINGAPDAEGQDWFNQIRDRAFKDQAHRINLSTMGKTDGLNIIFKERGLEFMDEMQRWFDIMRFDKGTEILGSKGWKEKYRYFPISQKEIDASRGALTQNPGWK
jgi:hypothetical protein